MKKNRSKKLSMKKKRMLSTTKIERKWSEDTSKGSAGFVEYYKPKGIGLKHNPKPSCNLKTINHFTERLL